MSRKLIVSVLTALGLAFNSSALAEATHVVQKNETLSEIAEKFGVGMDQLMRRNHLQNAAKIHAGQRLAIPRNRAALSSDLSQRLEHVRIERGKWKYIVIHHSGSESGSARAFDRYHREERHMENGLAYHFVIGNGNGMADGEIAIGNRWKEQLDGGHLASESLNEKSIGICLVGNFDEERPSERQMRALDALINYLLDHCHLKTSAIKTHQKINPIYTRCPGRHFPTQDFLKEIKQERS